jgi:hypothetical protein
MSMSANLHRTQRAEASQLGTASNVKFVDDEDNHVVVFMPYDVAAKVAIAFNEGLLELES